jgi:hypothetical protein
VSISKTFENHSFFFQGKIGSQVMTLPKLEESKDNNKNK